MDVKSTSRLIAAGKHTNRRVCKVTRRNWRAMTNEKTCSCGAFVGVLTGRWPFSHLILLASRMVLSLPFAWWLSFDALFGLAAGNLVSGPSAFLGYRDAQRADSVSRRCAGYVFG